MQLGETIMPKRWRTSPQWMQLTHDLRKLAGEFVRGSFGHHKKDIPTLTNALAYKGPPVSRIQARSETLQTFMQIDVITEIHPIKGQEKFADGTADSGYYFESKQASIADKYEYIMHGRLYKIQEEVAGSEPKAEVIISFGGLLMMLKGNPGYVTDSELDQKYFLCTRKLA